jgi:2-polyprenyl-3-methyl-5-hydroxy-6-metoxy-1,4-benzoquinol methylase
MKNNIEIKYSKSFDPRKMSRGVEWWRKISEHQSRLAEEFLHIANIRGHCPICGSANSTKIIEVFGVGYLECGQCTHVYSNLCPSELQVKQLYDEVDGINEKSIQSDVYLNDELYNVRAKAIGEPKVKFVSDYACADGGEWLDIGCGTGEIVQSAKLQGWRARGVEANRSFVKFAVERGLKVKHTYVTLSNVKDVVGNASVISMFNLLEHVEHPADILRMITSVAAPGTTIAAEVPRHPSISYLSNLLFPNAVVRHFCPPDHLHIFSDRSIFKAFTDSGVEVVAIWYFGQDFTDILMSGLASSGPSWPTEKYIDEVHDAASAIQNAIDRSGLADTMIVVGRVLKGVA